jgi:hypothetical protein
MYGDMVLCNHFLATNWLLHTNQFDHILYSYNLCHSRFCNLIFLFVYVKYKSINSLDVLLLFLFIHLLSFSYFSFGISEERINFFELGQPSQWVQ